MLRAARGNNAFIVAIPELTRRNAERLLEAFCERRVPPHVRDKVRMSFATRGNSVTLVEHRPVFMRPDTWTDIGIAQFRFDATSTRWKLYCADRNGRWHRYTRKRPAADIAALLREVDRDPTCIFWG